MHQFKHNILAITKTEVMCKQTCEYAPALSSSTPWTSLIRSQHRLLPSYKPIKTGQ